MDDRKGKVWLVGAGPSDPELITVKGLSLLKNADVVIYDRLIDAQLLNWIPKTAKMIAVGKSPDHHPVPQEEINRILLDEALRGNKVVRLKGGDPFLFGRGGEELELLHKHGIPFEVVPGVTSAVSVPAYAGIPVTHRDFCSSVHIITGHTKKGEQHDIDFEAAVKTKGTLVFLMGVAALKSICDGLISAGMPPSMPAAVIERGTTARQKKIISTLENLSADAAGNNIKNPAVIVVGQVCALSEQFEWTSGRPLNGKRIVVTRPEKLSSVLSEKIREKGGEAVEFPCIETRPLEDERLFEEAVSRIRTYDWAVFTSAEGVEMLFDKLSAMKKDIRELYGLKIGVIGGGTEKAFNKRGIMADFVPENYDAAHLAEGLAKLVKTDEKVLILRAKEGTKVLTETLAEAGIYYDDIPVYETVYCADNCQFSKDIVQNGDFDMAAFTSASTVRGFAAAMPDLDYKTVTAVCIGEETAKAAREYGMRCIVAKKATLDSLVEAMADC